jgi:hypothetical protein
MIVDKKYLTPEYIYTLCVGIIRYDSIDYDIKSLESIGKLLNYLFTNKINSYSLLSKIYETDNLVYIHILAYLLDFKIVSPNLNHDEIKQNIINKLENKVDNNSFNKANKFIDYVIKHIHDPKINNTSLNIEFDKTLKYIVLNESVNKLTLLYQDFYSQEDHFDSYDKTLASVFVKYEESITRDDFVLDGNDESLSGALEESATVQEEVRVVDILKDIRFIEKKRIAIIIGASGAGKSMFLCHANADFIQNKKSDNKKHLVFYFTFENSKSETLLRIVANVVDISIDQLKEDIKDPTKKKNIINKYKEKKDPNTILIISELPPKRHTMNSVEAIIDKNLTKFPDAIVYSVTLDYIDKMLPVHGSRTLRTDEALGLIADDFKALSKTYDTCGLTVSQFNREGAKKARSDDDNASATDIGGGWSKYENADLVLTMQVKDTFDELGYNIVVFVNEKHRYYKDGTVIDCIYKPDKAKFLIGSPEHGGAMAGQFESPMDSTNNDIIDKVSLF